MGLLASAATTLGTDADTEVLELQPGNNFVGWVAEPIAVADIFDAIPAASLIYRWNADERTYRSAVREMDGTLETIEPGMAVKIRIDGRKAVQWERPLTPAKGMVTLYSGVNWVAWIGRDGWPLDKVARGIGSSLISIEVEERGIVYQPDSDVSETIGALVGDTAIRRGDALRVTVNRDLRWLQPTGMMPNVVLVGDMSRSLKDDIETDVRHAVDFFADEFALETDFSETTILVFADVESAVKHEESDKEPKFGYPPEVLRSELTHHHLAAARPWGFYMPTCRWQLPCPPHGGQGRPIGTLAHEMFHHVQRQLSQREPLTSPVWLHEGAATWAESRLPTGLRGVPNETERESRLRDVARVKATLQSVEWPYTGLAYRLGPLAANSLADLGGVDAHIEYNRQLYPQIIGAERRWVQGSDWKQAFAAGFGLTTTEFYSEFEAWRKTLPAPARRYDYDPNDVVLSGSLRYKDEEPATGFRVHAAKYLDGLNVAFDRTAYVDDDGAFSIEVAPETTQRIEITRGNCKLWLTNDGLTVTQPQAGQHRDLDTRKLPNLDLTLPEGACENELHAHVTRLRNDEREVQVFLIDTETYDWTQARSGSSETYTGYAPEPGEYLLDVRLDDCGIWYTKSGMVASIHDADVLELGKDTVSIEFRIPNNMCVQKISGRVLKEGGTAAVGVWLIASYNGADSGSRTSADGRFSITVPDSGDYVLFTGTDVAGCHVVYATEGPTSEWQQATSITVADEDVTDIEFVIPSGPASLCR